MIYIINRLVSEGGQLVSVSLTSFPPPLLLLTNTSASRPEVLCEFFGELSLLLALLSHRWQVVPCPAWGRKGREEKGGMKEEKWSGRRPRSEILLRVRG